MATQMITPLMRKNFRYLYADVTWYGILSGSAMAFILIYITRLGATSFQLSLVSAGPAIINLLASAPAGRWLENRALVQVTYRTALLSRFGYWLLIPLAWFFSSETQILLVILVTVLMSLPGTILAIAFNALYADLVPPEWRGEVVGKRNALMAISMTIATLVCGVVLDRLTFPLNYQVVFAIGALGATMSTYYVGRLQQTRFSEIKRVGNRLGDYARPGLIRFTDTFRLPVGLRFLTRSSGSPLLRLDLLQGVMGRFMFAYLIFYIFQYTPIPLFPIATVRHLNLMDGQISLGNSLFYGTMMLVSLRIGPISNKLGHRKMLVISALSYSLYPLLIGLARDANLFWVASLVGGVIWAMISASLTNRLMEVTGAEHRPAFMAMHNIVLNLGILVGALLAPVLSETMSIPNALFTSAFFRFLAGILLFFWG